MRTKPFENDWARIFADEVTKQILIVSTIRMILKTAVGNTYFPKRNCGLDVGNFGKNLEHPDGKEAMKELRRVRAADPSATRAEQPQQRQPTTPAAHAHFTVEEV